LIHAHGLGSSRVKVLERTQESIKFYWPVHE